MSGPPRSPDGSRAAREVIGAYAAFGFWTRLYVRLRLVSAPLVETERHFPAGGRVLDLGCGHGIFAHLLHRGSSAREVVGIDLMPDRIEKARRTIPPDGRLSFEVGDARGFPQGRFDVIACIDLLHHMPWQAQEELLGKIAKALPADGLLVIKDLEKTPLWKYLFHYVQDWTMYRFRPLFFRSRAEMTSALDRMGMRVEVISLARALPYPHVLYLARWKD